MEKMKKNFLWFDGIPGLMVGILMFILIDWLVGIFKLPKDLLIMIASANVIYGLYATFLAIRNKRSRWMIAVLAIANGSWFVISFSLILFVVKEASFFGYAHIAAEGLFCGWLAFNEWKWRDDLVLTGT